MSLLVDIWIYSLILFLRAWKGENYNKGFVWVKIPSFLQTFSFLSDYSRFSYILPKVFILSRLRTLRAQACLRLKKASELTCVSIPVSSSLPLSL